MFLYKVYSDSGFFTVNNLHFRCEIQLFRFFNKFIHLCIFWFIVAFILALMFI